MQKNKDNIKQIQSDVEQLTIGPQGATGPAGAQGVQGNTGPAGPDGTPVAGLSYSSETDATLGGVSVSIIASDLNLGNGSFFFAYANYYTTYFDFYIDDVNQNIKISAFMPFYITFTNGNQFRLSYYDETEGSEKTTKTIIADITSTTILKLNATSSFSIYELVKGSTVGPTGPAGATGPQGVAGPTGPQGIQGLPGEKNMSYVSTLAHLDTFSGYLYRCLIQVVGGDYDGITFIKETLTDGDSIKFGPYGSLATFTDVTSAIEVQLFLGVTSLRVYKIANIT